MQATRLVRVDGEPRDIARDMRSGGITGIHPTKQGSLSAAHTDAEVEFTLEATDAVLRQL